MASILSMIGALFIAQIILFWVLRKAGFMQMAVAVAMIGTWLTFPGVILREVCHKLLCDILSIPVYEAKYFQLKYPAGYVHHGKPDRYRDAYLLAVGPFAVNTVAAMITFVPLCFGFDNIVYIALLWLGISFAINAFPRDADAETLWRQSERTAFNPFASIGLSLAMFIWFAQKLKRYVRFSIVYAAGIYCVTFCLLAVVLMAGSVVVPGVYAVSVTPAISEKNIDLGYHYPTYNPMPATPRPTPLSSVNGLEGSAKEWLQTADIAMKKENGNAVLIYIHGYSKDRGVSLPVNGKSHEWWYQYVVPDSGKIYNVIVHDGVLSSLKEGKTKNGNVPIGNWTMDSTDIVAAANAKYKEMSGCDPLSCAYVLEGSFYPGYRGVPVWEVCYYDPTSRVSGNLQIDLNTGEAVNYWAPPKT